MELHKKSIVQLRSIAQGFGISDIFSKDHTQLLQAIELKKEKMIPEAVYVPPRPEYDARLMTAEPNSITEREEVESALNRHVEHGLHLSFPDPETWQMQLGNKTDTGTLRQPLRNIMLCAEKVLK